MSGGPRLLISRLSTGGIILCFHSLTGRELPSEVSVHVPVTFFERVVRTLRRFGEIVPLKELVQRHVDGKPTSGLVALTCDDAYAALLSLAGKIVRDEQVPLTVFVVTEAANDASRYWWDRIDDLFPKAPEALWRSFEAEVGVPESFRRGQPPRLGPLRPLRQWILHRYKGRWPAELEPTLSVMEEEVGFETAHRSMSFDELARFMADGPVDVGVHTLTHPVLPLLSKDEFAREVRGAFDQLRDRFDEAVPILAIPYGLFDQDTQRLARQAGMIASLTLEGRAIDRRDEDDTVLPRYCISRGDRSWKLALKLFGLPLVGRGRSVERTYPSLPSASS